MPVRVRIAPTATRFGSVTPWSTPALGDRARTATPAAGSSSRHHTRRLRGLAARTTPSGSTATERIVKRVTTTAASGTASSTSTASAGAGVKSAGKAAKLQNRTPPMSSRPKRKRAVPSSRPSAEPASASPAAIHRVIPVSAPTSRSAASRLSRRSPPNRTAVAMKMITGSSSTTQATTVSATRTGLSGSFSTTPPNAWVRLAPLAWVRVELPA